MSSPPGAVFTDVRDTDPDTLDAEGLAHFVAQIARLTAWCESRRVRAVRRQRELATQGRAPDPRDTLSRHGRQSGREAAAADARDAVCTSMPGFEDALAAGTVSAGHVDAIANATRQLDEHDRAEFAAESASLLGDATRQGVDTFARNCRDLARSIRNRSGADAEVDELERQRAQAKVSRWVDRETGLHHTHLTLDPVSDRQFWSAVQRRRNLIRARTTNRQVSWDRLTVDAVVEAVSHAGSGSGHTVASIAVHVGLDRLVGADVDGAGPCEADDGTPLPVATVRRLACDGDILPVVLDGRGIVLDQGRARRLATAEQRTAIEAMQRTCSHPDCTVTVDDCRIHHVDPWSRGGRTDLADLAPLCEVHHHLVHDGGWTFQLDADRVATWIRPDGVHYWSGPISDRRRSTA